MKHENELTIATIGLGRDRWDIVTDGPTRVDWLKTLDAHLLRHITNRNARTGQTWHVTKRYATNGDGRRCAIDADDAWGYERAVIENEYGTHIRIYYRGSCWVVA